MVMKNQFASIDLADLSAVTGGVTASGASTTDQNAAMLQMVTQLQSSIQTLAQGQQQDPMSQMMPMMMMMGMKH
jgi:hypothetical protein